MERRMERLTADKLDAFIDLRLTQLKEEGTLETDLRPALEDYLHRHLADGSFVSWILTEGHRILATSGISFVETPPYPGSPNGRIGLLSCISNPNELEKKELHPIPGSPPDLLNIQENCPFADRCEHAMKVCKMAMPQADKFSETHFCSCWLNHPYAQGKGV